MLEKTGSSASCAIATSVIAYLKCISPTLDAVKLQKVFEKTSTDLGEQGKDAYYGYGLLNMKRAVLYLMDPVYLWYE